MGMEMESDVEKSCSSDLSPNTVLPQRHCSSSEKKKINVKPLHRDEILRVKDGFAEISFRRYKSASCKSSQYRRVGLESKIEQKRGSVYQSSRKVTKMKNMGNDEGRRQIELSRASESSFSFRIVDSLCSSDEDNTLKRASVTSMKSKLSQTSVTKPLIEPCSSEGYIEFVSELEKREKLSAATVRSVLMENQDYGCEQVVGPLNDGNELLERDTARTFHKSLSAKVEMPRSPPPDTSEHNCASKASSKTRFAPIKKMLDPFKKSKSLRSPLGYVAEAGNAKSFGSENVARNQALLKSLPQNFSSTAQKLDFGSQPVQKDFHHSSVACSPVHLHGCLKLENKHGVPFFEFSLNCPEEVLVAKTWKANNAFNWVYTFHSVSNRKKSNASQCRLSDSTKESSLLGQMQVSCYLCSELKEGGDFENSMVTEFVLYDIAHARNSVSTEDSPDFAKSSDGLNPRSIASDDIPAAPNHRNQVKHAFLSRNFDLSNPNPCPSAVLHPDLEIAAIVIQFPFSKRESLKCKRGNKPSNKRHSNLHKLSMVEQEKHRNEHPHGESPEMVKVVIPTGNHSLPSAENRGPSPLLDRWRLGGSCDCGGWDMACPLTVFGNPGVQFAEDKLLMSKKRPLQLFVQGASRNIPALTLTYAQEGEYAVDFHAQLSTLQAFSICVAILHGTETSGSSVKERQNQLPHCNSLKMLIEEEVKFLMDAVSEKEQKKKSHKRVEELQQSYALNPPFSPIARV